MADGESDHAATANHPIELFDLDDFSDSGRATPPT